MSESASRPDGFTLIELMIVVAIVAIIAAIAYPSYVENVRRSRLTDAQMVLMMAAQWMEQMNAIGDKDEDIKANEYPSATVFRTKSGLTRSPKEAKTNEDAFYLITNEILEDKGYELTATPRTGQQSRGCKSISIDNKGNRKANIDGDKTKEVMDCWK